jgi:hypothetical protein
MSPWHSITTAPMDGAPVDLFKKTSRQRRRVINCRYLNGKWLKQNGRQAFNKGGPTHWMEIPPDPEEETAS